MNQRIKKLRKALDLTQQEFADKIGMKRNTVANYETDRNEPSSSVISLICREFNVNETWLRTGEGEMFVQRTAEDELAAAVERLITGESAEFKKRLVNALATLKDEHWLLLEQKLKEIVGMPETAPVFAPAPAVDSSGQERIEPDIAAKVAELERQNQELAAKVAAMEEEDALLGLTDAFSVSPLASAGSARPAEKIKK